MSRPLVAFAVLIGALCGLAPLAAMVVRVDVSELAALIESRHLRLFARTLAYGGGVALLATLLGAPYGWLVARSDLPGARWLRPLGLVPLCLPPMLIAMVWTVLADVRGAPAACLVSVLATWPLVALLTARAAERVDGRLVDAARLAGGRRAVLAAEVPLIAPAIAVGACLAFVFTANDFSVPDYVSWVGTKFSVYADQVFASWKIDQSAGEAVATALPLIALTLASLLPALALRRRGALASLRGDFRAPARLELGALRWPACAACAGLVLVSAGVPIARLVWETGGGSRGFAAAHVASAFGRALELARGDLRNSLVWAAAAATAATALGLVIGHALERARHGRWFEPLALLPLAVPAVLFGIGVIAAWNRPGLERFYDGGGLVVALYVGRFLAFPVLVVSAAVASLDPGGEEAARLAGAGPARRLASIVAPPLRGALALSWSLVFVLCLRELDATILVPAANHTAMFRIFNAVHFGRDDFVAALALMVVFLTLLPGLVWAVARGRTEVRA
ncbi:MAG TPA: ABC transporter permease subunit [Planctomycetota bacterium]|nr:ABC transporter permease subunit [Planctomycetota bacterium]